MASVYRPGGRRKYRIEFKDQHGNIRTIPAHTDKRASHELARKLEIDAQRLATGLPAEYPSVTGPILGLVAQGIHQPWNKAADAYLVDLIRRGSPADGPTVSEARRILAAIAKATGWSALHSATADTFATYLADLQTAGRAPRTLNRHHETLRAFLNWCVSPQKWLAANPIAGMKMSPVGQRGRARLRRPYSPAEWQRLLAAAPEPRRTVYLVAGFSGFRRSELVRMQKQDCTPAGTRPRWHTRPGVSKNGLAANLPMLPDCAAVLLPLWQSLPEPTSPLFRDRQGRSAVPHIITLHTDLETAGIPRQDARGRWADFHSFRYFFCSQMAARYPIQIVQRLMRHSTIKLTADLYADLGLEDVGDEGIVLAPLFTAPAPAPPDQGQDGHAA